MTKIKEITVDGVTYYSQKLQDNQGDIKIAILQRGWVMVGVFERNGNDCKLKNSSVIRIWGTKKGLGEIAQDGPTKDTVLDKNYGVVEFDYLTVVALISCNQEKWFTAL